MAESRSDSSRSSRGRRSATRRRQIAPQDLPHFSLLADPAQIAGVATEPPPRPEGGEELERLRAELERRTFEMQELRRDLSLELTLRTGRELESGRLKSELEALRRRADTREVALREAQTTLAIARQTIDRQRAERRAQIESGAPPEAKRLSAGRARGPSNPDREQALARALRECASRGQAIAELEAAATTLHEALEAQRFETADCERRLETMRRREATRSEQIEALRDELQQSERRTQRLEGELRQRCEQIEEARYETRRAESERTRLTRTLSIIEKTAAGQLATEISQPEPTPESASTGTGSNEAESGDPEATTSETEPESAEAGSDGSPPGHTNSPPTAIDDASPSGARHVTSAAPDSERCARSAAPPAKRLEPPARQSPIFRYWRDAQLRSELARHGYAGCDDLFASAIADQCERAGGRDIRVLALAGRQSTDLEGRLRSRLQAMGFDAPEFDRLLLAGPEFTATHIPNPIDGGPVRRSFVSNGPDWHPGVRYDAIVSDQALDHWLREGDATERIEALLETLHAALHPEGAWVLVQRLGRRVIAAGSRVSRMGERIWQLMPERYKYDHVREELRSQFARTPPEESTARVTPATGQPLLGLLERRFRLERQALFGCLADAFVGPELGPNFDPAREGDRRFIDQIAALDAAKIRAGVLEPLHLAAVARPAGCR